MCSSDSRIRSCSWNSIKANMQFIVVSLRSEAQLSRFDITCVLNRIISELNTKMIVLLNTSMKCNADATMNDLKVVNDTALSLLHCF